MAEIRVQNLRKAFAEFVAVRDSTFTIHDGEFFCLLGPSGCGKTTTLRLIAGLELPTAGAIFLGGDNVTLKKASARDIAFVFQLFALYPHMNVKQNIAFPLVSQGIPKAQINKSIEQAARILQITHLLEKSVNGLSSGDRQRVALGRAIVREPLAFMMDEPLGALDAEFRELMCGELRGLHERLRATTVYVTHDQREAMAMADKIAIMNNGLVEKLGTPQEVYEFPASVFVADFIGSPAMNFLPFEGTLAVGDVSVQINLQTVAVPALREALFAEKLLLGIRPEHVRFNCESPVRAQVIGTEYLGSNQIVILKTVDGTVVRAKVDLSHRVERGDQLGLIFETEQVTLFERASGRALRTARNDAYVAVSNHKQHAGVANG